MPSSTLAFSITLACLAAAGYAIATIGMKSTAQGQVSLGVALATAGCLLAFVTEVRLMQQIELSVLYITIIAVETLLVLTYAAAIGEGLDLRQSAGAALVFAGLVVVSV